MQGHEAANEQVNIRHDAVCSLVPLFLNRRVIEE
jgi:hypothetical protein